MTILSLGTIVRTKYEIQVTSNDKPIQRVPARTFGLIDYHIDEEAEVDPETGEILGYGAYGIVWCCDDGVDGTELPCVELVTENFDVCERQLRS